MIKSAMVSSEHSIVLMKWLSRATKRIGRDVAENTYVVGGAVRNFKLNMPVKDVDLVLDSIALGENSAWLADELADMIPARTETVSDQYGVAKIFVKSEWVVDGLDLSEFSADGDAAIEIVDARSETYSDDTGGGYKPSVEKATIREDIYRRDFTFNTLMWRLADLAEGPDQAEIIDMTGCGLDDLKAGEARCPLDPVQTFHDDPTRILRAIKFLVKYGLKIPRDTAQAIIRTKRSLLKVSADRVLPEILKILNERTWKKVFSSFEDLGLFEVLKEIAEKNQPFRSALSTKAKRLPYMFFIKLLNMEIAVKHDLSVLSRNQIARLEEIAFTLTDEEQLDLVKHIKSPGGALKDRSFLPTLAREKGIDRSNIQQFMSRKMDQMREMYVSDPSIINKPDLIKRRISKMAKRKKLAVSNAHSTALMKWLSRATSSMGRGVAENIYVAGGAIRNFMIDQPVVDVDVVVDAEVLGKNAEWVAGNLVDMIPAQTHVMTDWYGTHIWVNSEWIVDGVDLSEFSKEGDAAIEIRDVEEYPEEEKLEGSNLYTSLTNRDYTFNMLMWRLSDLAEGPDQAEIIDMTGCGLDDLEAGEARCFLDADKTLSKDPTRIIRAVKFVVKYGLKIPKDTFQAIKRNKHKLKEQSSDRVYRELLHIFKSKTWKDALICLDKLGVIEVLAEIAREDKKFRAGLSTHSKKLPYMFFINLVNKGFKLQHDLGALTREQLRRMEELSLELTPEEQSDLVSALRSPSSVLKDRSLLPNLARNQGFSGRGMKDFMMSVTSKLRDMYLSNPSIIYDKEQVKDNLTLDLPTMRVASRYSQKRLAYVSRAHSTALMKWLSQATKRLGRDVAENTYIFGGAVRNFMLNAPIKDVDAVLDSIALGKDSAWLIEKLAEMIPAETEVMVSEDGVSKIWVESEWIVDGVDLSEFSAEGEAAIEIADAQTSTQERATIEQDVQRRDFTYNTLMWRLSDLANGPDKAEIIDLTGCGVRDLEAGVSVCPNDPEQAFRDSPIRMIRAVKFLIKYGMKITKETAKAIKKNRKILLRENHNILYVELEKLLDDKNWKKTLLALKHLGLLDIIVEVAKSNKDFNSALGNHSRTLPYMFFIEMTDLGLSLKHDLSFLDEDDIDRLEEIAELMDEDQQEDLVIAMKSPGWAIKDKKFLPSLAKLKGIKGPAIKNFMILKMEQLRDLYLESPMIIYRPNDIKSRMTEAPVRTASQSVASRYMEAKLFGLLSNHIGWQDLKRFEDQLQWMFKKGQHNVNGVLNRKGEKVIKIEAPDTKISISGFTQKGSGYDYKTLVVEINGRVAKKTDDLEVVRKVVLKTLLDLGLKK